MSFGNPTEIELAWADFIKAGNAEARECLIARQRATQARRLVPRPKRLPAGAQPLRKIIERSTLVYPIGGR